MSGKMMTKARLNGKVAILIEEVFMVIVLDVEK